MKDMSIKRASATVIRNAEGEYLFQLRDRHPKNYPFMFGCSAGAQEENETPVQAAVRELAEEFEIHVTADELEEVLETYEEDTGFTLTMFILKDRTIEWRDIPSVNEGAGAVFFDEQEIDYFKDKIVPSHYLALQKVMKAK